MQVGEIADIIEKSFPIADAEKWDNVGLLVGRREKQATKAMLTLDVTPFVVQEAIENGADIIISHHPVLFTPASRITDEAYEGEMLIRLIENGIAVYAAHTNLDKGVGGINDYLADMFELVDTEVVEPSDREGIGLGRIGRLKKQMTARELAYLVKERLSTPVRLSGNGEKKVSVLAVGSGASDDIIPRAVEMGADAVITGDCKYHRNQAYAELGVAVVDAGHYPTEICVLDIFKSLLKNTGIELVCSENKDIFEFI